MAALVDEGQARGEQAEGPKRRNDVRPDNIKPATITDLRITRPACGLPAKRFQCVGSVHSKGLNRFPGAKALQLDMDTP